MIMIAHRSRPSTPGGGGGGGGGSSSASSASSTTTANGNGGSAVVVGPAAGGAASAAATGNAGQGGGRLAVIGVTRNVKLRRRGNASFGFSLRGGREHSAGFFVSDVVLGGEAHRAGLRVGDQILRVNGYPVEDAVHQEVALLAKNQQVLVLKIRSVGMIPVKDNPNDPVTWHMVQQQQKQLQYGDAVTNEVRIRVMVGEKGSLGCGVCRGLVPGLTVQNTREGGPARAAGLKAGDVIVWCNGQHLTDLPFERAIEVMRCAAVLDLVVNRPIVNHVYDCPESLWQRGSSGYDSESSSTGTPSPHNTASSPQHRTLDPRLIHNCNSRNGRHCYQPPNGTNSADWGHVEQEWTRKPNNTTIIRINQSHHGTPQHHHQFHQSQQQQQQQQQHHRPGTYGSQTMRRPPPPRPPVRASYEEGDEPIYDPVAPKDFECHDFDANPRDELDRRAEYRREHGIIDHQQSVVNSDVVFVKENGHQVLDGGSVVLNGGSSRPVQSIQSPLQPQQQDQKSITTVEVHQPSPPPAPSMPQPVPYKWPAETKPMNAMGMQMGSTMSMGSTGSTETESSLESSCGGKDCAASTTSSLSTSSSGEPATCNGASTVLSSFTSSMHKSSEINRHGTIKAAPVKVPTPPVAPPVPIDLSTAITQELQRRAKQRSMSNASNGQHQEQGDKNSAENRKQTQNPEALKAQEQKVTHDKLMEEFKRAHQRMFSNAQQRNPEQNSNSEQNHDQEKRPNFVKSTNKPIIAPKPTTNHHQSSSINQINNNNNNNNKHNNNDDEAVEMQSIESFKLKESPAAVPKPPPTYFPAAKDQSKNIKEQKTMAVGTDINSSNGTMTMKPLKPVKPQAVTSVVRSVSKVAIRIGSYNENDGKKPGKLSFLTEKAKQDSANNAVSAAAAPAASRFQNELVATLQRSNLRRQIEGENEITSVVEDNNIMAQENGQQIQVTGGTQNYIEKLSNALNNKVTIRVNPEANAR
uniref:PDZ domain-containing protein n=1 Tax=Trichogramma kaykai TaxID=54128 RepID=A0ABD2W901_9HYME